MPKFVYSARDIAGQKITGNEEAISPDELILRLQAKNLIVISVTPQLQDEGVFKSQAPAGRMKLWHYGVNSDDLVIFCRQLATLLGAAVTILKSLDIIGRQISSRKLYSVIRALMKSMEGGLSFHEALSKHPKVFSQLWINLVETGEASGNLPTVLSRLASYLERSASFRRKIISNLIYPVILMAAAAFALLFLTLKIIPTFADLFKGFNIPLPLLTRILLSISDFMRNYIVHIAIAAIVTIFLLREYIKTKKGRKRFEQFQFSLPVFGEFYRSIAVERFSAGMSTLIESGVPILYSLEITEHSVSNLILADIVHRTKEEVRNGKSLSQTLEKSEFFDPMVIQMIAVGEEVGDLPQMLKRINTFYQEYTETFLTRFTALFEPATIIFMGLVIGIIVIGMFLPVFQIATISSTG